MNWKCMHRWFSDNLVEPFFQAEMHRVKMHSKELSDITPSHAMEKTEPMLQEYLFWQPHPDICIPAGSKK